MFVITWIDKTGNELMVTKKCKTVSELKESINILNRSSVSTLLGVDSILINSSGQLIYIERR